MSADKEGDVYAEDSSCVFCGTNDIPSLIPGHFGMSCSECSLHLAAEADEEDEVDEVDEEAADAERRSPKRDREDDNICQNCREESDYICPSCSSCDNCCDFDICQNCNGHCEGEDVPVIEEGVFYCEECACTQCGHLYRKKGGNAVETMCLVCAAKDKKKLAAEDQIIFWETCINCDECNEVGCDSCLCAKCDAPLFPNNTAAPLLPKDMCSKCQSKQKNK